MQGADFQPRDLFKIAVAISAAPLSSPWLRTAQAAPDGTLTVALSDKSGDLRSDKHEQP